MSGKRCSTYSLLWFSHPVVWHVNFLQGLSFDNWRIITPLACLLAFPMLCLTPASIKDYWLPIYRGSQVHCCTHIVEHDIPFASLFGVTRYSVMFSLRLFSNSLLLSVHYSLIVWHFPVTWFCLHKWLPQILGRFFLLTFSFLSVWTLSQCAVLERPSESSGHVCGRWIFLSRQPILTGSTSCPRRSTFTLFCSTALAYSFSQKSPF